jgi:hypothetical protein
MMQIDAKHIRNLLAISIICEYGMGKFSFAKTQIQKKYLFSFQNRF